MAICYDCQTEIGEDFVLERRQVSGGGHNDPSTVPGDFKKVPVHVNRLACRKAKKDKEDRTLYSIECRICGANVRFRMPTRKTDLRNHMMTYHPYDRIIDAIVDGVTVFGGGYRLEKEG